MSLRNSSPVFSRLAARFFAEVSSGSEFHVVLPCVMTSPIFVGLLNSYVSLVCLELVFCS